MCKGCICKKCVYEPCEDCFVCEMVGILKSTECSAFKEGKSVGLRLEEGGG